MFHLGRILATPGALAALQCARQSSCPFLARHGMGDWGDISEEDKQLNNTALKDGGRILSAYRTSLGVKLWVITEAVDDQGERAATTILLPEEY